MEHAALFAGISPDDYTRIEAAARVMEFARGETLYIQGDQVREVLLVTSGYVKITQSGQSGTGVILRLALPGDVLGAAGLFSTGTHCTTAQVLFRSYRALVWDAVAFQALVERFPVLKQNLMRILDEDTLELEGRYGYAATERVGPRVAHQLARLMAEMGRPVGGGVEIGLSREELARMTGTTLFTVSRLLSAWETRGILKPRREALTICDVQSLLAESEED